MICANEDVVLSKYKKDVLVKKYTPEFETQLIPCDELPSQFKFIIKLNNEKCHPALCDRKYNHFWRMQKSILERNAFSNCGKNISGFNKTPTPLKNLSRTSKKQFAAPLESDIDKQLNPSHSFGNCDKSLSNIQDHSFSSEEHDVYDRELNYENEESDEQFLLKLKRNLENLSITISIPKNSQKYIIPLGSYPQIHRTISGLIQKSGQKFNHSKCNESSLISSSSVCKFTAADTHKSIYLKKNHYSLAKSLASIKLIKNNAMKQDKNLIVIKDQAKKPAIIKLNKNKALHQLRKNNYVENRKKISKSSIIVEDDKGQTTSRIPLRVNNKSLLRKQQHKKTPFNSSRGVYDENLKKICKKGWETFRNNGIKRSHNSIERKTQRHKIYYDSNETLIQKTVSYIVA